MDKPRRLVVGLGNPGDRFEGTRHNVGFRVLDFLARREGLFFEPSTYLDGYGGPANLDAARMFDPDALLVKPRTFMNSSGEAVAPLLDWAGRTPAELLIVFDDMDLPVGALRLRSKGGAGGQRGMVSIIESLRTDRFARLRIGIGRSETDAARHVLSAFSTPELEKIDASVAQAAEAVFAWLVDGDIETQMTRFHSRWNQSAEDASG